MKKLEKKNRTNPQVTGTYYTIIRKYEKVYLHNYLCLHYKSIIEHQKSFIHKICTD